MGDAFSKSSNIYIYIFFYYYYYCFFFNADDGDDHNDEDGEEMMHWWTIKFILHICQPEIFSQPYIFNTCTLKLQIYTLKN